MLEAAPGRFSVSLEYFALFRARAGKGGESVEIATARAADLYEEVRARYGFPLGRETVHLAINDEYAPWETPLRPGDRVVFIPPVSGG